MAIFAHLIDLLRAKGDTQATAFAPLAKHARLASLAAHRGAGSRLPLGLFLQDLHKSHCGTSLFHNLPQTQKGRIAMHMTTRPLDGTMIGSLQLTVERWHVTIYRLRSSVQ
jgi:hypothetical protein